MLQSFSILKGSVAPHAPGRPSRSSSSCTTGSPSCCSCSPACSSPPGSSWGTGSGAWQDPYGDISTAPWTPTAGWLPPIPSVRPTSRRLALKYRIQESANQKIPLSIPTGITTNISICQDTKAEKEIESRFDLAATYIEDRWGTHSLYGLQYIFCEVLSILNLIVQSYLVDIFLGGEFLGLGYFYIPYYSAKRLQDPIRMFPLVTNCYFKKYGASGFVDTIDALCVLPINALNVKIYLFIWVWFAILLGLSFASLMHFCLAWFAPKYRNLPLVLKSLVFRNRVNYGYYKRVVMRGNFGDWFVLSSIKNNMDSLEFSHLMENLWYKLSNVGTETKEP
ncbi:innexin inx2 [Caerostris extrusa]|uniref:Innexin n=1 Tax=Caerostris extrusa TaxID=172846 RepID=A0AAV4XM25_CAEEX|nr:innexin inx2 [Caerostris extrusa]